MTDSKIAGIKEPRAKFRGSLFITNQQKLLCPLSFFFGSGSSSAGLLHFIISKAIREAQVRHS